MDGPSCNIPKEIWMDTPSMHWQSHSTKWLHRHEHFDPSTVPSDPSSLSSPYLWAEHKRKHKVRLSFDGSNCNPMPISSDRSKKQMSSLRFRSVTVIMAQHHFGFAHWDFQLHCSLLWRRKAVLMVQKRAHPKNTIPIQHGRCRSTIWGLDNIQWTDIPFRYKLIDSSLNLDVWMKAFKRWKDSAKSKIITYMLYLLNSHSLWSVEPLPNVQSVIWVWRWLCIF